MRVNSIILILYYRHGDNLDNLLSNNVIIGYILSFQLTLFNFDNGDLFC